MFLRLFMMLTLAFPAGGQQDGLTVKEIRQMYAEVQQAIAAMSEEEHLRNQVVTTIQTNMPGSGIRKETRTAYFAEYDESVEEGDFNPDYRPYFITRKYNVGSLHYYEEYLYDAETGIPVFVFIQSYLPDHPGTKNETRYYYGPMGLISEIIKGEREMDEQAAADQGGSLWESVKSQLNNFKFLAL